MTMSDFATKRAELIAKVVVPWADQRLALANLTDEWLCELARAAGVDAVGGAVIAVGGYGRRELSPGSDLDIMLVVDAGAHPEKVMDVANALWYPIWDAGLRLDHSVRTVAEARTMAAADLKVVLGMMDARTVYGNDLARMQFMDAVQSDWQSLGAKRLMELHVHVRERMERYGELAHMLEPDLKESYGGLRDLSVLRGIAVSGVAQVDLDALEQANQLLLDVRDALHRVTGRATDRLMLQEQPAVAELLGMDSHDALLRAVCAAGRTISYVSDLTWHRIRRQAAQAPRARWSRRTVLSAKSDETPIAEGVVIQDGEAVITESANPSQDAILILRAAAAAAQSGVRLSPETVDRLATECPPLPTPWPRAAREALVSLLGAGRLAIPVWESLDQRDLITRMIPEWSVVRSAPQHNPIHTFTVDRHLVETAVNASTMTRRVSRPDLLLIGSLFHDIGKGYEGDHSEVGERIVRVLAARMGFNDEEVEVLAQMVLHHLLLPEMGTRRDLDDPATIDHVAALVKTHDMLELLHALSESDSRATGPAVNSEWRFALISDLVKRVHSSISGEPAPAPPELNPAQQALADGDGVQVIIDTKSTLPMVTVAAPDSVGLLSLTAGVLAVNRLNVRTATTQTIGKRAVSEWGVTSQYGDMPSADQLKLDLERALAGELDVTTRLDRRYRESMPKDFTAPEPLVSVIEDASARATVIELRAHDMPGLLHIVTNAISETGVDIIAARVSTLGSEIVDAFYVVENTNDEQTHLDPQRAQVVQDAILASLAL
jgi:[protein-PII] uridylyltransferase